MTSIDKLKKINEMTKVLRQHGLSTDDAVKQSSDLYNEKIESNNSENINTDLGETSQDNIQHNSKENSVVCNDSLNGIKRMQSNFQERIAHIENNVSNIIEKMNEMIKTIKDLESRPIASPENPQTILKSENNVDKDSGNNNVNAGNDSNTSGNTSGNSSGCNSRNESNDSKPRTGDFKPGEVDIMDYFNFSKK